MVPLLDALRRHAARGTASFHTPGHKGRLEPGCAAAFDLTGAARYRQPVRRWGCDRSVGAPLRRGLRSGRFLLQRGRVHPVYPDHAASRLRRGRRTDPDGAQRPSQCGEYRCFAGAGAGLAVAGIWRRPWLPAGSGKTWTKKLKTNNDIRAVYITSPDYTGRLADVAGMAALCHGRGIPLLVDNAHGSHLGAFGLHPLMLGADMTADSWHKTLPVLTGGAVLHLRRMEGGKRRPPCSAAGPRR